MKIPTSLLRRSWNVPRLLLASLGLSLGAAVPSVSAADGVNLQPAYYNNGNVNFGWSLMRQQGNIRRLRIEVDTSRVSAATARGWIDQAKANGYNDIIVTFHQYGGSDSTADLQTAANWWRNNYSSLGGGFTVNLINEWGSHNISASAYAAAYNTAISTVRSVYSGQIIVDIPGWGQETLTALNAFTNSSPRVNDGNLAVSTHIYPGNWNQGRNHTYNTNDMNDLVAIGKTILVGEFGTGAGACDWSACVDFARNRGWSVLAWAWNGDGNSLNMVSPSWATNSTASSFSTNSYFNTVYPKLGGGGGGGSVPNGTYSLQNRANGKMLDNLGATADGANIGQWADGSSNNQRWVVSTTGSYRKLQCVTGGKFLDSMGRTADGSLVGQWTNGGSYNQQWTISATDSGYYKIVNRANGKGLDTGGQSGDGAIVQQWYSNTSHNQQWRFVAP